MLGGGGNEGSGVGRNGGVRGSMGITGGTEVGEGSGREGGEEGVRG